MTDEQAMVEAFHRKFEIVAQTAPMDVSEETKHLRVRLIQEEFDELKEAMASGNLAAVAKEMADLLYVTYGTAVSYGIDMEPVFQEVHRSNLSKIGGYKRADGKWVKPPPIRRRISNRFWRSNVSNCRRSGYRCMMPPVCPRVHERSTLPKLRNPLRPSRL